VPGHVVPVRVGRDHQLGSRRNRADAPLAYQDGLICRKRLTDDVDDRGPDECR
jgi:hypothetical protein